MLDSMIEQGLDKTWENFDADGSGFIDRKEMRQITIELFKWAKATDSNMFDGKDELTDEMIDEQFNKVDIDNNGTISKLEFE